MQEQDDPSSLHHLVELGYVDPHDVAAREAAKRREQQAELQRATQLSAQSKLEQVAELLERVATAEPNWIAPRQLLAETYYRLSRFNDAQEQLNWLTFHGIESPRLALFAGAMALSRRDIASALELLEYASYVEPDLPSVHRLFGTALLRAGRVDESANAFTEALRRNGNDVRALDGLASLCLRQAKFEEAADWALRALELDMRHFEAHYHLGLALAGLSRTDEAIRAFETAVRVDPSRSAPYRRLARIAAEQLNDPERATRYCGRGREVIRQRRKVKRGD